jgi:hypothetical protein
MTLWYEYPNGIQAGPFRLYPFKWCHKGFGRAWYISCLNVGSKERAADNPVFKAIGIINESSIDNPKALGHLRI